MAEYDYIVVGGGSAGCVLASRLSEDAASRVLLVEAGRKDSDPWIHVPGTFYRVLRKGVDVKTYAGEPDKGRNGRPYYLPQANVLGGGSSINGMVYMRGQPADYDTWAQMGCPNWSYEKVLPVFKAQEGNIRFSGEFHGTNGPIIVSDKGYGHPLCDAFIRAAQEVGIPYNPDFNGKQQEGVGYYQLTTSNGRRWSAVKAYLRAAAKRPNLTILTKRRAVRIQFSGRRASGVKLQDGSIVSCRREIAVAAGAVGSPTLLMLSGIGNARHLKELGIEVVADLPGVGENLQDHVLAGVQAETVAPISMLGQDRGWAAMRNLLQYAVAKSGPLTSNVVEAGAFIDTAGMGRPDVQLDVLPLLIGWIDRPPLPGHGISIDASFLRPMSRGSVRLRSADATVPPILNANTLSHPKDVETLMRGVRLAIRILEAPSLTRLVRQRLLPGSGVDDDSEALERYVRDIARTVFHPVGTCKMGPSTDEMAVVGEDLRVHGLDSLRVCDASIMPVLISGNTNAPAMMIGDRAASLIIMRETVTRTQ